MRERGLKFLCSWVFDELVLVAPHAGAWIEIPDGSRRHPCGESLPMRERGLKFGQVVGSLVVDRRSPCGSVD